MNCAQRSSFPLKLTNNIWIHKNIKITAKSCLTNQARHHNAMTKVRLPHAQSFHSSEMKSKRNNNASSVQPHTQSSTCWKYTISLHSMINALMSVTLPALSRHKSNRVIAWYVSKPSNVKRAQSNTWLTAVTQDSTLTTFPSMKSFTCGKLRNPPRTKLNFNTFTNTTIKKTKSSNN